MLMDIVWFLVIGLVAGWLASLITKRERKGIVSYIAIGLAGWLVGRILFRLFISFVRAARRACRRHGGRRHSAFCSSKNLVKSTRGNSCLHLTAKSNQATESWRMFASSSEEPADYRRQTRRRMLLQLLSHLRIFGMDWRSNWSTASPFRMRMSPTIIPSLQGKIVLAHLKETLDYYVRLRVAEIVRGHAQGLDRQQFREAHAKVSPLDVRQGGLSEP